MSETINVLKELWPVYLFIVGNWAWYKFFYRKERRLFKNIKRPIAVIGTESKPMTHEVKLLERVGFFNVESPSTDSRTTDLLGDKRLLIIGYTAGTDILKQSIEAVRSRDVPLIVYAGPRDITDEDMKLLQSYSNHSMCNTPLRLISDVFAIMATYPETIQ